LKWLQILVHSLNGHGKDSATSRYTPWNQCSFISNLYSNTFQIANIMANGQCRLKLNDIWKQRKDLYNITQAWICWLYTFFWNVVCCIGTLGGTQLVWAGNKRMARGGYGVPDDFSGNNVQDVPRPNLD
jgi:hypothetical protein